MKTLAYSHTEYVVTHDRTIRWGIIRTQPRKDEFTSEEKALSCVRALHELAASNAKSEDRDLISNIEIRSRQVWTSEWETL